MDDTFDLGLSDAAADTSPQRTVSPLTFPLSATRQVERYLNFGDTGPGLQIYKTLQASFGESLPSLIAEVKARRAAAPKAVEVKQAAPKAEPAPPARTEVAPEPKEPPKRRGLFHKPKRVSKSPETWRHLSNYPGYEISSHGRVRSLDRAAPGDWLKPRRRWYKGLPVDSVVLKDRDGKRREPLVGSLLVAARFLKHWNE
jgi:hypothetical protein